MISGNEHLIMKTIWQRLNLFVFLYRNDRRGNHRADRSRERNEPPRRRDDRDRNHRDNRDNRDSRDRRDRRRKFPYHHLS